MQSFCNLYASESWTFSRRTINRLQVSISKCLRQIVNIYWPDKIIRNWSGTRYRLKEGNRVGLDTHYEEMTTALANKLCSGNRKATEGEVDHGTCNLFMERPSYIPQNYCGHISHVIVIMQGFLQCCDTVGWVTGRTSSLQYLAPTITKGFGLEDL